MILSTEELWDQLHDLFDSDEGSLPDIFIEELSTQQIREIYIWVRSHSQVYCDDGEPTLWDRNQNMDIPIKSINDPSQLVLDGAAEPFRHGLSNLVISGVELHSLTIAVYPDSIDFDYRMGAEWGVLQLTTLFSFLWEIQRIAPNAKISHAYEGVRERTKSFNEAWEKYLEMKLSLIK